VPFTSLDFGQDSPSYRYTTTGARDHKAVLHLTETRTRVQVTVLWLLSGELSAPFFNKWVSITPVYVVSFNCDRPSAHRDTAIHSGAGSITGSWWASHAEASYLLQCGDTGRSRVL